MNTAKADQLISASYNAAQFDESRVGGLAQSLSASGWVRDELFSQEVCRVGMLDQHLREMTKSVDE